jgi:hypothetical protein
VFELAISVLGVPYPSHPHSTAALESKLVLIGRKSDAVGAAVHLCLDDLGGPAGNRTALRFTDDAGLLRLQKLAAHTTTVRDLLSTSHADAEAALAALSAAIQSYQATKDGSTAALSSSSSAPVALVQDEVLPSSDDVSAAGAVAMVVETPAQETVGWFEGYTGPDSDDDALTPEQRKEK